MIFDNSIIFDEEQVGQVGNKVAPGQHNAILWKLKWRKVPLWEICQKKMEYWTSVFHPSYTQSIFERLTVFYCRPQHNIEEIGFEESAFAKGTKTRSTFLNHCRKERLGRIKQVRFPTILATVLTGCHRWPGGRPENTFSQSI